MILYKDNPNLGIKTVKTINGETEYRRNCRLIKDGFYVMEKDCFFINGKWHRVNSGLIVFDNENKEWVLKESVYLIHGIVGFHENGEPIHGYFRPNPYNNVTVNSRKTRGIYTAINSEILYENGYFEDLGSGHWRYRKELSNDDYLYYTSIHCDINYKNKGYNIEDNGEEFFDKKEKFKNYPIRFSKEIKRYSKFIGDITWGCEFESCNGVIPDNIQYRTGLVACRDGSLPGNAGEFVTIPLSGAKGLQNMVNICNEMTRRCEVDITCSFHIHLGNLPISRNYLVASYILFSKIQDELFKMFPYYKTKPEGIKQKNYCQKLKKLSIYPLKDITKEGYKEYVNVVYNKLFTFLTEGVTPCKVYNRKNKLHPKHQKWERASRYFALNFINAFFSDRGTLEHRLHPGTTNYQKVINWLFICVAIARYAQSHELEIITTSKKIDMSNVLNYYRDAFPGDERAARLSDYLIKYFNQRVETFKNDFANGDYVSSHDIINDKTFSFTPDGSYLF